MMLNRTLAVAVSERMRICHVRHLLHLLHVGMPLVIASVSCRSQICIGNKIHSVLFVMEHSFLLNVC